MPERVIIQNCRISKDESLKLFTKPRAILKLLHSYAQFIIDSSGINEKARWKRLQFI